MSACSHPGPEVPAALLRLSLGLEVLAALFGLSLGTVLPYLRRILDMNKCS